MKKIITLSGHSQRFLDEGFTIKPLIRIHNKLIIEYVVDSIREEHEMDFSNYVFIVKNSDVIDYDIDNILRELFPKCIIKEISPHHDGPVVSILSVIDDVCNFDDEILISYCDLYINWKIEEFITFVRDGAHDGSIVSHSGFHPHRIKNKYFAYMRVDGNDLLEIQEKRPFTDDPDSEYASGGIYYFKSCRLMKHYFLKLLKDDKRVNNEFYVTMSYNKMVEDGLKITHYDSKNYVCLGTPTDVNIFLSSLYLLNYFNDNYDINRVLEYFRNNNFNK